MIRDWPVRPNTTPVRDFCQSWLCQFPYVSVIRAPYGTLAGHARAPYGSRRIWKTLKIPVRGPYDARTGIARCSRGVLRIIQPNHKYAEVSSRTGTLAWCDHGNSTDEKFLRGLHSALRARIRTGDKNRTGSVVGCDRHYGQEIIRVIKIARGPWLDVTEALQYCPDVLCLSGDFYAILYDLCPWFKPKSRQLIRRLGVRRFWPLHDMIPG